MSDEKAAAIAGVRRQVRELVDGTLEVKIHIDPRYKADFHRLFPEIDKAVALAPLANHAAMPEAPAPAPVAGERSLAQRLHISGYFRNPRLWRALHDAGIYTVAKHKAFVEGLPCAAPAHEGSCSGEVCAHHTKAASVPAAGARLQPDAPQKPPHWYTVALCHRHHREWAHGTATREDKERLLETAIQTMAAQAKGAIKYVLQLQSLAEIDERTLAGFEESIGVMLDTSWG